MYYINPADDALEMRLYDRFLQDVLPQIRTAISMLAAYGSFVCYAFYANIDNSHTIQGKQKCLLVAGLLCGSVAIASQYALSNGKIQSARKSRCIAQEVDASSDNVNARHEDAIKNMLREIDTLYMGALCRAPATSTADKCEDSNGLTINNKSLIRMLYVASRYVSSLLGDPRYVGHSGGDPKSRRGSVDICLDRGQEPNLDRVVDLLRRPQKDASNEGKQIEEPMQPESIMQHCEASGHTLNNRQQCSISLQYPVSNR